MIKQFPKISVALAVLGIIFAFAASAANASQVTIGSPTVNSSSSAMTVAGVLQVKGKYKHYGTYVAIAKSKVKKKKGTNKLDCFWKYGTWTNTVRLNGGAIKRYKETSRAKFCRLKKPIVVGGVKFTHVKAAGGKTGSPCFNLAIPPGERKQPKPQLKGSVMDMRELNYSVTYELKGSATVQAQATCVTLGGSASATATGNGSFSMRVTIRIKAKSKTQASVNGASRVSLQHKQSVELKAQGSARLDLEAKAAVSCAKGDIIVTPPCEVTGTCPKPPVSASCTGLTVESDLAIARGIRATVTYAAQNTTLSSVMFSWGDGTTSVGSSTTASHQYANAGTYTVYATLTFRDIHGKVTDVTCAATTVTAKDGTVGPGTGIPTQPGGPGAGGTPGPSEGTGESCRLPSGAIGYKDQFGHCNPY